MIYSLSFSLNNSAADNCYEKTTGSHMQQKSREDDIIMMTCRNEDTISNKLRYTNKKNSKFYQSHQTSSLDKTLQYPRLNLHLIF